MNPWVNLPRVPPYVLGEDDEAIHAFNQRVNGAFEIRLEIVPEPFLGNPVAPVVLLNLNPGFVDDDRTVHLDEGFNAAARENLRHGHADYPFYLLDPRLPDSPGREWWKKKLGALIRMTSVESVASKVFVIEIHGYHSRRFHAGLRVPSQVYTRELVLCAIKRNARIVFMRGVRHWMQLVPELGSARTSRVRSVQNPSITPRNCEDFEGIEAAIGCRS